MLNHDLFDQESDPVPVYRMYMPVIEQISNDPHPINIWDIPYTIPQLSYLVHSDYRYYGKFPSVVAGQILDQIPRPTTEHYVLDNFCGSGTTLVEANLRGIKSFGTDISWLSVLASNVKSRSNNIENILINLEKMVAWFENNKNNFTAPNDKFCEKWFSQHTARDLSAIQSYIKNLPFSDTRDFLLVAFIAIIRRVSKAFDGEVRPHINKDKKSRDVISAFSKKIRDMCNNHVEYSKHLKIGVEGRCILQDNTSISNTFNDDLCYLVISHPPYLNSFNYAPVYSLEFYWGKVFETEYSQGSISLYKDELKAHPANESITEKYFDHLKKCYQESFKMQPDGAYLAIVVGDCTRKGELIPVCSKVIDIVKHIGYSLIEENYRTTHYGLGKYAYSHRADYHGDQKEKRDGILIFKK
tara:strand:- start:1842 stop:3080 length:1239 start_codon:yes stop_codon:yes gene_type:complete